MCICDRFQTYFKTTVRFCHPPFLTGEGMQKATPSPYIDKGMVKPESGGMSVVPSPEDLVDIRRPPAYGGRGKDPLWSINTNTLGPKLKYVPDIPEGATHGTIQPAYPMTYNEYQNALGDTQPFWRLEP